MTDKRDVKKINKVINMLNATLVAYDGVLKAIEELPPNEQYAVNINLGHNKGNIRTAHDMAKKIKEDYYE